MENIADLFYEKLGTAESPGNILAQFYNSIFDQPNSVQKIIMFNKLIKVYGKYIPFFAILDLFSYEKAEVTENMFGLLSYYCKRRLEQKTELVVLNDAYRSLDKTAKDILDRIEEQKEKPMKIKRME
jgi:hypothetical protein